MPWLALLMLYVFFLVFGVLVRLYKQKEGGENSRVWRGPCLAMPCWCSPLLLVLLLDPLCCDCCDLLFVVLFEEMENCR